MSRAAVFKKPSRNYLADLLPSRSRNSNKSHGGRSLIIAGSAGLWGAGILCARAAARSGSGYVTLMTNLRHFPLYEHPDFLTADTKRQKIKSLQFDSVAIGPGLGKTVTSEKLLKELLRLRIKNVVVDADALIVCARKKIFTLPSSWILTPHEGELAKMLNVSSTKIVLHRRKYALLAQKKYGCIVLLKGHRSLIVSANRNYEIPFGNPSLAKSGTGDVLTGIIAAFLAQGLSPLDAAVLGACVHGRIADEWIHEKNDHLSFMASDLIERLPKSLFSLRKFRSRGR
jgi:ADP-dependent NAD(P)H-hydrate dehydratase